MKKILLITISILLLAGCSTKLSSVKEGVEENITLLAGNIPEASELVEVKEGVELSEELAGNKLIVVATKDDKAETTEFNIEYETVNLDGTAKVDLSQFYTDPAKLSKVSYSFNDDETIMTVTDENGEEANTFDVPVSVSYPSYTVAEDITIDTYVGYDINDFVTADEGVEVTSKLNENILTITLSKGIWSETLEKEVTLEDSSPMTIHKLAKTHGYPIVYSGNGLIPYTFTFHDENTVTLWSPENRGNVNGTVTYDENSIAWAPNCTSWNIKGGFGKNYYSLSEDGSIMHYDNGDSPNSSPYMFDFYLQ